MMKELPFVKHMMREVQPQRFARLVPLSRFVSADMKADLHHVDRVVTANVNLHFSHRVPEDRALNGEALSEVKRKAIKAFAVDLFGPVASELEEVMFLIWDHDIEGAADRIERLIPILRGETI